MLKAKFRNPLGTICWKLFNTEKEMRQWFEKNKMCEYISKEEV